MYISGSQPMDYNPFGVGQTALSQGSPKTICISDIYIEVLGGRKIIVQK